MTKTLKAAPHFQKILDIFRRKCYILVLFMHCGTNIESVWKIFEPQQEEVDPANYTLPSGCRWSLCWVTVSKK